MTQAAGRPLETVAAGSTRRVSGYLCYAAGPMLGCATGAILTGFFPSINVGGSFLTFLIAVVGVGASAAALLAAAEGLLVPSAREICERDPRRPVLFLRPFDEDKDLVYDVVSAGDTMTTITAKAEDFLLALNAVGPLVSIGKPTWLSRLGIYPLGAFRDYVSAGAWQYRVEQLLDRAGMVVLAVGDSPGIEWEIVQARKRIGPESLLVYLAPRPAEAYTRKTRARKEQAVYEQFAPMLRRHFEIEPPPFSEALYIVGFDAAGAPVMAPDAERSRWVCTEHGRVADAVTAQLNAVLARIRPEVDLARYRVPGRAAMWWRLSLAITAFFAAFGYGLWSNFFR